MTGKFDGYESAVRELSIANAAIQEAAMMLGSTDEWTDQAAMIADFQNRFNIKLALLGTPEPLNIDDAEWGMRLTVRGKHRSSLALRDAAQELVNFAWTMVTARNDESRDYLNELINNVRVALRDREEE